MLEKCWGLRQLLVKQGLVIMEQLHKFEFKVKLPQLTRFCLSTHFTSEDQMELFLEEQLPNLEYLELSMVELSDKIIVSASKKVK